MAIRIRKIKGTTVALCAAKSKPKKGDLYLDDACHHALTIKFESDFRKMEFMNDIITIDGKEISAATLIFMATNKWK